MESLPLGIVIVQSYSRGAEFALHEDVSALQQAWSDLGGARSEREHVVPLRFLIPLTFIVLPGPGGCNRQFCNRRAVWKVFDLGVATDESDDRKLIEVHVISFFLPVCRGTLKRVAAAPNPSKCFLPGTARISPASLRERASQERIVGVLPKKAERTPASGAGFSPEAVPNDGVGRRRIGPVSYSNQSFS